MRAPRTERRLVSEQPGVCRRAHGEGPERKLDAEFPAGGVDPQDPIGWRLI
jgi:hypothetical protein